MYIILAWPRLLNASLCSTGVFGGLQLHGVDPGIIRTNLNVTANVGDQTLTVVDNTGWVSGNEILLTTTSYNSWHTETFTISSVSGNVITLNDTVKFTHLGKVTEYNCRLITDRILLLP